MIITDGLRDYIKKKEIDWIYDPFPHAIIDDFLPKKIFSEISNISVADLDGLLVSKKNSEIENKQEYGSAALNGNLLLPLELMGKDIGKSVFKDILNINKLLTMSDFEDFGGYYPFHASLNEGSLGSHVDHSSLEKNYHVANSLFYVSKDWKEEWGGKTILFNQNGLKPIKYIDPKPNRMVIFIHHNKSFHGVTKVTCPENISRNSYYMDYYLTQEDTREFQDRFYELSKTKIKYSYHPATFIPFIPHGLKHFKIKSIVNPNNYKYIPNLIFYLIFKLPFISSLRFRFFDEIRKLKTGHLKKK